VDTVPGVTVPQADTAELAGFSAPVRAWFETSFPAPTAAQVGAWGPISRGEHTLLCAPTGSGKTLAAFLWALDLLGRPGPVRPAGVSVLYVSPLRALAVDIEKNLRSPLRGIALAAERLGEGFRPPTVGVRTGDTTANERRALVRDPPDILITTPESLYLMLTSQARETLRGCRSVIVDEIHALAPTKRGAHLALTLERLEHLVANAPGAEVPSGGRTGTVQRIGLSATQRPLEVVADYLGGNVACAPDDGAVVMRPRAVTIVDSGTRKELDIEVVVPVDDMGALGGPASAPPDGSAPDGGGPRRSIWPSMHPELLRLVEQHRSTLVFVNARRLAERLASRLNELAEEAAAPDGRTAPAGAEGPVDVQAAEPAPELVKAHHGSLSRERRLLVEDELKRGELRGLVATSSLELGIDMGAVDLVVQVESPGSVASGLQRIGRAGHQVGAPSRGRIFPKHRADLLEAAVVVERMRDGLIEHTRVPANPLDVLAQQVVAACALDEWSVDELFLLCRSAANYRDLSSELFENTLDLLAGRYPAEDFSELRPRVVWDRLGGTVRGRAGAQRLAVTSGGTIPDRGLYGVFLPDGTRVGELDEEMVYESRVGETFLLGASTWRIEDITFERVIVTPAPGQPGKMPFWHGDGPGREAELGRALGQFIRELRSVPAEQAHERLRARNSLDERAAANVMAYLDEQSEATGVVPDDRTLVVERFRDEIGDWRICIHSPFGARVHAPWATVLRARLADHFAGSDQAEAGLAPEVLWSDDGIVIRLPEAAEDLPVELLLPDPDEVEGEVVAALPGTAAFAARFREASARALLLPRRRPDRRTPLWQQRQRAADLLAVASRYPGFPMLLEAVRECCNDVFDLPALRQLLTEVRSRRVRVVQVDTPAASPFARSLLFGWIAVFMYEGDAPLAERRAAALALDRELLRDLLGAEELRSLLDPEVVDQVEMELQRLVPGRFARDADELHDLVRVLGPLSADELGARVEDSVRDGLDAWLDELLRERRVIEVGVAGERRLAASEDAGRLRDALGVAVPPGLPAAFTEPVEAPLQDLVERYARTHGPFTLGAVTGRLGVSAEVIRLSLGRLVSSGRLAEGEFRPGGRETEWCDAEVLRRIRRRSLAALRKEVEPVDGSALGRFLPRWQGVGSARRGPDALAEVIGVLQAAPIPASILEADVLGIRIGDYRPTELDLLCSTGEVVWLGAGAIGARDGRVRLVFRDQVAALVPRPEPDAAATGVGHHEVLREHLAGRGASFWQDLVAAVAAARLPYDDQTVLAALWDLVWAGEVTNDTLAPLRARVVARPDRRASGVRSRRSSAGMARRHARPLASGPPPGVGRWSLTAPLFEPAPPPTVAATQRAMQLLERYGVLTREMALAEGAEGGFAGVYPVLKLLEERGQVRRGYFVDGLGAAQFAKPGAVDLLRAAGERSLDVPSPRMPWDPVDDPGEGPDTWVLAATDPAQPYGAALPWPGSAGQPARAVGAFVVMVGGEACAYLERGGRRLLTFPAAADHPAWVEVLAGLVDDGRVRRLRIEAIDAVPAATSGHADALRAAGFADGYKGLTRGS
jgi:ATP-dependent helicase Lhr and Lhr-like helicase